MINLFKPCYEGIRNMCKGAQIHVTAARKKEIASLGVTGGIPASTLVPTVRGLRLAGDLKAGEVIFAQDGSQTKIATIVRHAPDTQLYEVELKDGRTVQCSGTALWQVYRWTHRQRTRILAPILLSTNQIVARGVALHRTADAGETHSWNKFHVPMCETLQYHEKDLPVDPYVVGAFLGDGNIGEYAKMLTFSCSDEDDETVARIAKIIGAAGYLKSSEKTYIWQFLLPDDLKQKTGRQYFHIMDVFENLPELIHNANEKYIPDAYKYSSVEQRWALVQGLMDTDGTIGATHSSWHTQKKKAIVSFSSVSPQLANDFHEVILSLGLSARIGITDRRGQSHTHSNGRTYTRQSIEYDVIISCPNDIKADFFRLDRKRQRGVRVKDVRVKRDYRYQSISDIRPISSDEDIIGIKVNHSSHLFLVGDCIVMHDASLPDEII